MILRQNNDQKSIRSRERPIYQWKGFGICFASMINTDNSEEKNDGYK
jgi:hypothetical protein